MRPYSTDLRERIIQHHTAGVHHDEIASTFQVSHRTIERYVRRLQTTGSLEAGITTGRHRFVNNDQLLVFEKQLENYSDMTLEQHQKLWFETQNQRLSTATISRMIKRLGWTLKKNVSRDRTQRGFTPNVA
jgi:transposase